MASIAQLRLGLATALGTYLECVFISLYLMK